MGAMSKASAELYAEVSDAVLLEVEQIGVDGINAAGIVARFVGREVSERTLFRWVEKILASGQPGQHLAKRVKAAAAERSARVPDPAEAAEEVATEARELMPARVSPDDIVAAAAPADAPGRPKIRVIEMLADVIADAQLVVAHAKIDGKPRNPRLLLQAGESLRRAAETALKVTAAMNDIDKMEQFHEDLLNSVESVARKHGHEIGEEMFLALRRVHERWAARGP